MVNPPSNCVDDDRTEPPLGLLYLAAAARATGVNAVSVCDMTGAASEPDIDRGIAEIPEADVYGIGTLSTNYRYVQQIVRNIRKRTPAAYVVVGGPHATALPERTMEEIAPDAVVTGEGEDAFSDCITAFTAASPLLGIVRRPGRADVDSYSPPARDLVDMTSYSRRLMGRPLACLISSRGCGRHCLHCNSIVMGGGAGTARYRSPSSVVGELAGMRAGFECFRFNDDNFTGNPELAELLGMMTELDVRFRIFAMVEHLTEEVCSLLAQSGCVHVAVGLESLSSDNLAAIGKASQIGKEGNVRIAKEHGLTVRASFMVGLPYDSDVTVTACFERAAMLGLDEFAVYPLIPYPGTRIWCDPAKYGYTIVQDDFRQYVQIGRGGSSIYALSHRNFGPDDVRRWHSLADQLLRNAGVRPMALSKIAT